MVVVINRVTAYRYMVF